MRQSSAVGQSMNKPIGSAYKPSPMSNLPPRAPLRYPTGAIFAQTAVKVVSDPFGPGSSFGSGGKNHSTNNQKRLETEAGKQQFLEVTDYASGRLLRARLNEHR